MKQWFEFTFLFPIKSLNITKFKIKAKYNT